MKIFSIDNLNCTAFYDLNKNALIDNSNRKAVKKGNKIILLPLHYDEIIYSGGYLPHIKINGIICKYCNKCRLWTNIKVFIKNKYSKDGYKDCCRNCDNERRREHYAKTRAVT